MSDLRWAGLAQYYRNDVKAAGPVPYIIGFEKISGGSGQFGFLGGCYNRLCRREALVGSGFYLDKNNRPIVSDHNKVDFAGLTGEVANERFKTFIFQELFAAVFAPSAKQSALGQ